MGEYPSAEKQEVLNPILNMRDKYRSGATETQRGVAEQQAAKFEMAVLRLMRRSGDNSHLVNEMNHFLNALDNRSRFGLESESLDETFIGLLIGFFRDAREKVENLWGNRTARR